MKKLPLILAMCMMSNGFAKDIAPKEPPVVPIMGQVIDQTKPGYIPQFLSPPGPSQLQQERDWATRNTIPPCFLGMMIPMRAGCYGYVTNHGFYR